MTFEVVDDEVEEAMPECANTVEDADECDDTEVDETIELRHLGVCNGASALWRGRAQPRPHADYDEAFWLTLAS